MFGTVGDRGYLEAGELRIFAFFVLTGIDNRRTVDNRDAGGDNTERAPMDGQTAKSWGGK